MNTAGGVFTHLLGSSTALNSAMLQGYDHLYLQVTLDGIPGERLRLTSAPFALLAAGIEARDADDTLAIMTDADDHRLSVYGSRGQEQIRLHGNDSGRITIFNPLTGEEAVALAASTDSGGQLVLGQTGGVPGITLTGGASGDDAVILPDSSVSSLESLNEAGFTLDINVHPVTLQNLSMTDLVTIEIETPAEGYIVLQGKCYVELSGTTGANLAMIQIDEDEGGSSQFPYYSLAGLNSFVDIGPAYFPVYVTRVYYRSAGVYEFRMEGRSSYPLPALAKSWDHVLTATYYPTSYGPVYKISNQPGDHPEAVPQNLDDPSRPDENGLYYKMDLRYYEKEGEDAVNRRDN